MRRIFAAVWHWLARRGKKQAETAKQPVRKVVEGAWYRAKPKDTRVAGHESDETGVWIRMPENDEKTWIHSHPHGIAVPSHSDWLNFQDFFTNRNVRTMHLLGLDEEGKVAGRLTLRPTRKMIELAKKDKIGYLNTVGIMGPELVWKRKIELNSVEFGYALVKWLEERKLAKVRVKPSPGFEFKQGVFVKKQA